MTYLKVVRYLADVVEVQVLEDVYLATGGSPGARRLPQGKPRQGWEARVHLTPSINCPTLRSLCYSF